MFEPYYIQVQIDRPTICTDVRLWILPELKPLTEDYQSWSHLGVLTWSNGRTICKGPTIHVIIVST